MFIRVLNRMEEGFIAFLLVAMTLMVFVEVFDRFVFGQGIIWMEELTLHASAWMVLFGTSWGLKVGAHIGVEAFIKLFKESTQRIMGGLAILLSLVYVLLIFWGGLVYLEKLYSIDIEMEDLVFPKWIAHSVLSWGMILIAIRLVQMFWLVWKGESTGFHHEDEAQEALHRLEQEQQKHAEEGANQ